MLCLCFIGILEEKSYDEIKKSVQITKKRKCQRLHYSLSPYDYNEVSYENAYSTLQNEWSKQKPKRRVLKELLIATMNEHQTWVIATGAKVKNVMKKYSMLRKKCCVSFFN